MALPVGSPEGKQPVTPEELEENKVELRAFEASHGWKSGGGEIGAAILRAANTPPPTAEGGQASPQTPPSNPSK
jgi:hypothetical protein